MSDCSHSLLSKWGIPANGSGEVNDTDFDQDPTMISVTTFYQGCEPDGNMHVIEINNSRESRDYSDRVLL